MVKNLPEMQETQVRPLIWKDLLEKATVTHSNILAWRITWTEGLVVQQTAGQDQVTKLSLFYICVCVCVCVCVCANYVGNCL